MAVQKPTKLPVWDANETNITEPPSTNQSDGWQVDANGIPQKPPFQYHNYMWNLQYKWIEYLDAEKENITDNDAKLALKANVNGDNEQKFKVADAEEDYEALSKGQLLEAIKEVDGDDSGINATTVNGTPKELLGIGGEGYQWVDETDNREFGTEYTNTSGKPIQLSISFDDSSSDDDGSYDFYIDGTSVCNSIWSSATPRIAINLIIPNGSSYESSMTGTKNLRTWFELK